MKTKKIIALLFLAFFSVILAEKIYGYGTENTEKTRNLSDTDFREKFFSDEMWEKKDLLNAKVRQYLIQVKEEASYFPVPESTLDPSLKVSYTNSWMTERTFGGDRGHEGTDLMAEKNERGCYPIVSICDGIITNLGWLEKGGYRIGITSDSGTYYYYAHLDSYGNIQEGDFVRAGEFLGYMGDSGYGEEGTVGKFPVHLHIGIYFYEGEKEISVNPYYLLRVLEKKKLKYELPV